MGIQRSTQKAKIADIRLEWELTSDSLTLETGSRQKDTVLIVLCDIVGNNFEIDP